MTKTEREIRILGGLHIEARKADQAPVLTGYAAIFNVETDIAGLFRERIAPGAFAEAIHRLIQGLEKALVAFY